MTGGDIPRAEFFRGRTSRLRRRPEPGTAAVEIILELFFEFVGQIVLESLLDSAFRPIARVLANRVVRMVLGVSLAMSVGYAAGNWWGSRLSELGRTEPPRSLWVSIALAVAFAALAPLRALRSTTVIADTGPAAAPRSRPPILPWQWSPARLLGFALLNASVASGIVVGFTPRPLR